MNPSSLSADVCQYRAVILHQGLLTADNSRGVPAEANVGTLQFPEKVPGAIRPTLDLLGRRKDGKGTHDLAVGVREEVLADLVAAKCESLRELQIATVVDGGKWVDGELGLSDRVQVDAVCCPLFIHAPIEIGVLLLQQSRRVWEDRGVTLVLAVGVLAYPAVPEHPAVAAAAIRANKAAAEGQLGSVPSGMVRNRRDD